MTASPRDPLFILTAVVLGGALSTALDAGLVGAVCFAALLWALWALALWRGQ